MISNQIIQSVINGTKNIARVELCVTDESGNIVCSTLEDPSKFSRPASGFAQSDEDNQEIDGWQYFKIFDELTLEYILIVGDGEDDVYTIGRMTAFQLTNLVVAYRERFDRDNFVKNLLLDNLLLVDIYGRARKLRIRINSPRVVFIADSGPERESAVLEMLRQNVGNGTRDFVTAVDENDVIIVRELSDNPDERDDEINDTLKQINQALSGSGDIRVAYGTVVQDLKEVSRSYKEARMAMDVGRIFNPDKKVIPYSRLGIGRIIYQLPMPLCRMFINETFRGLNPDELGEEMISTINHFFDNSLNVSETSRKLFIHRNTLVYRLDKLQRTTGLDLRTFEDAITFKIALMVVSYMKYMEDNVY
ncbi:MAG: helix-turn-helix domain-containing protein [Lachnospiraceae bacterium]|nr:helix-turn-helix domain-containing protein [Lachnospiraceae bacterium]